MLLWMVVPGVGTGLRDGDGLVVRGSGVVHDCVLPLTAQPGCCSRVFLALETLEWF